MKRIIGLLTMLFVMAACANGQVVNNKCSDGSTPAKTVSADGSYYVYICASDVASASDFTLLPNALKQIKVVKNWEPVTNFAALKDYAFNDYDYRWGYDKTKTMGCYDRIANVTPYPGTGTKVGGGDSNSVWFARCQQMFHDLAHKDPQIIGDIMLDWASNPVDPLTVIYNSKINVQTAGYQLPSVLGTFAQFYALWYDEVVYTSAERKLVDAYMTRKLMEQKFPVLGRNHKGPFRKCNINNINSVLNERTGTNNCGNIRNKVAVGEIMLGFRLEDQILLDKGHDDIYVVWAFINNKGININHAARGANTVNYYWDYNQYMTILAEIYKTVDYDFYEHTLPHGAKVHEYIAFSYRLLKDFTLTKKWAQHNVGSRHNPYSRIANLTQEQYEDHPDYGGSYSYKHGDKEFVKTHTPFVKRYMPDLYEQFNTKEIRSFMKSQHMIGSSKGVSAYMLYVGNTKTDTSSSTGKWPNVAKKVIIPMNYSLTPNTSKDWRKNYKNISYNN